MVHPLILPLLLHCIEILGLARHHITIKSTDDEDLEDIQSWFDDDTFLKKVPTVECFVPDVIKVLDKFDCKRSFEFFEVIHFLKWTIILFLNF